MTQLAWPLTNNRIRRGVRNNSYGNVRNGGTKFHAGWDLLAANGTPVYACADGTIALRYEERDYGNVLVLQFHLRDRVLFAAYCHLSLRMVLQDTVVRRGERIALTGATGNASNLVGDDEHLHFEIRTRARGAGTTIDPATLYGRSPVALEYIDQHGGQRTARSGVDGLKVRGVNVLP